MSTRRSTNTRVTVEPPNPSSSIRLASRAASAGEWTSATPPPLPRPPIWTWTLTATWPPAARRPRPLPAAWRRRRARAARCRARRTGPCPGARTDPLRRPGDREAFVQPLHDFAGRGAGREDLLDTGRLELRDVVLGDDAAAEHEHVRGTLVAQERHDPREQGHVRPEWHESPTASASSWMVVSAICSGVWCRPV